jgi:hypothetical protein
MNEQNENDNNIPKSKKLLKLEKRALREATSKNKRDLESKKIAERLRNTADKIEAQMKIEEDRYYRNVNNFDEEGNKALHEHFVNTGVLPSLTSRQGNIGIGGFRKLNRLGFRGADHQKELGIDKETVDKKDEALALKEEQLTLKDGEVSNLKTNVVVTRDLVALKAPDLLLEFDNINKG